MKIWIDIPGDVTLGDLMQAQGAVLQASTSFVDWNAVYGHKGGESVSAPGRVLLAVAHQLGDLDHKDFVVGDERTGGRTCHQ